MFSIFFLFPVFFAQEKVPLTPDEFTIQLTPSERAAIYDYVAQKVKNEKKLTEQETDSFLSTDLQEIVKQRDLGLFIYLDTGFYPDKL